MADPLPHPDDAAASAAAVSSRYVFWNEFCPDLVAGTLHGRTLAPSYLDLSAASIGGLADPAPEAPLSRLLVPELLVTGAPGPDDLPEVGIRGDVLRDRLLAGLPLTATP